MATGTTIEYTITFLSLTKSCYVILEQKRQQQKVETGYSLHSLSEEQRTAHQYTSTLHNFHTFHAIKP